MKKIKLQFAFFCLIAVLLWGGCASTDSDRQDNLSPFIGNDLYPEQVLTLAEISHIEWCVKQVAP